MSERVRPANGKKKKKPADARRTRIILIAAGGAGAALLLLLACGGGGLALFFMTRDQPNAGGPKAVAGGKDGVAAADAEDDLPPVDVKDPPVAPVPPAPWKVPPGAAAKQDMLGFDVIEGFTKEHVYPIAGCRDRYISTVSIPDPKADITVRFRPKLMVGKIEPPRIRPTVVPLILGTGHVRPDGYPSQHDMAPDGTLAIMDVYSPDGKIDLLRPGAEKTETLPNIVAGHEWFGWSASGRLLVFRKGRLVAWDVAADKQAFEAGDNLGKPLAFAPGRNWIVATVDQKYLEIRDAATGDVLGRLGGEGNWLQLAVSPDGKRLVGLRYVADKMPEFKYHQPVEFHTWDLATGQRTSVIKTRGNGTPVTWAGPDHFYHNDLLYDPALGVATIRLTLPETGGRRVRPAPSPDGRTWWADIGRAYAAAIPTQPPAGELAFKKGMPVKVEVTTNSPLHDKRAVAGLRRQLAYAGHPVGDSPWVMKVKAEEYDTGKAFFSTGGPATTKIPGVRGNAQLLAPDGTAVLTTKVEGVFPETASRYHVREVQNHPQFPGTILHEFDFKGRDGHAAMLEEVWERIDLGTPAGVLPAVWHSAGRYQPLPLPVTLELPAAARR